MFVKGGQITVDAERLTFSPNETNRYEDREPLCVFYPITSYFAYSFRKALAEAFLFGYGRVETGRELIEVLRELPMYFVRILSNDGKRGSSFKLTKSRLRAVFNALHLSARFEETLFRKGKTIVFSGAPGRLVIRVDGNEEKLDEAGKELIRFFFWDIFENKGKKICLREGNFMLTSEAPFVRFTDIKLSVGDFETPLDKEIILKLLALC